MFMRNEISIMKFILLHFAGKMMDYVKCLECGTEKSREDSFLDIPLPVRSFDSNISYNSVVSRQTLALYFNTQT